MKQTIGMAIGCIIMMGLTVGCASPQISKDAAQPSADDAKSAAAKTPQSESGEPYNVKPKEIGLTKLTMARLKERVEATDDFVIYVAVASCPDTPSFLNILKLYVDRHKLSANVYTLLVSTEEELEMLRLVTPRRWYRSDGQGWAPTMLIAMKNGAPLDWHQANPNRGDVEEQLRNFFGRNGYTDDQRVYAVNFDAEEINDDRMRRMIDEDASAMNFDGRSLDGWELIKRSFGGSSLQGTSLKGANLEGSSFAYANLKGAWLEGANLEGVTWYDTTCPDGTNSDENGGTCAGHLELVGR